MTDPTVAEEFSIPPAFRRKRRPRWIVPLVTFGLLALAGASAFGVFGSGPKPFTAHGTVSLTAADYSWQTAHDGVHCVGKGSDDDIGSTVTFVKITDEDGATIAIDSLDEGMIEGPNCVFHFSVGGVRAGRYLYGVEVGDRGGVSYTRGELSNGVAITIG